MSSVKSGLCSIAFASLVGTAAVVGCSADGEAVTDVVDEPTPVLPIEAAVLPPSSQDDSGGTPLSEGGTKDSGKTDSGPRPEAGVDAGPPPPVEGTPCPTSNVRVKKPCGACGYAETLCLDDGTGTGKGKWTGYGSCTDEVVGGCTPGSVVTEDCGNCGKATKTCTAFCAFTSGVCTGQPMNSCKPGSVDYTSAGCLAQTFRNRACSPTCNWGNYTLTCTAPVNANKLTLSATALGTVVGEYTLSDAKMGPRVTDSCPGAMVSTTLDHPYEIVEVRNPTAKIAKVSAWLTGATVIDSLMTAYNTNRPPQTSAELAACSWGSNDDCPSSLPCFTVDTDWAGLTGPDQITIPPGQVVLIRFSAFYSHPSTFAATTGPVTLTVRTDALQ